LVLSLPGRLNADEPDLFAQLEQIQNAFEALGDRFGPSVVAVRSERRLSTVHGGNPFEDVKDEDFYKSKNHLVKAAGSGVIIRANGVILTNEHVIQGAESVTIVLHDGREFDAVDMHTDSRSDLAVITIDATGLSPAKLGDLSRVRRGHWAVAMGNPYGFSKDGHAAMSYGIVSAIGRELRELDETQRRYYGNLIQTDAKINPGNSGGPLFNIQGEVIGINTAITTRSGSSDGVGFAVPISSRTRAIIDKLAAGKSIEYGFLGIRIRDRERLGNGGKAWGAVVDGLEPESPAVAAKLRSGDVIVEFDGTPIENADHLVRVVGGTAIGQPIPITYSRGSATLTGEVNLARREIGPREPSRLLVAWRGMKIGHLDEARRRQFDIDKDVTGLIITHVEENSIAAQAGLEPGQILEEIDMQRIATLDDLRQALGRAEGKANVRAGGREASLASTD
jgi:serine protease Do